MDLDRDLNPEQLEAVLHGSGPLLVLAGAGSGKTRVITYRIAHLVRERGVEPWRVLAVTFTNKAAGEMRERIESLVGNLEGLWALTFHSFGARLLRRHADLLGWGRDFSIYDADDSKRLGRIVLRGLDLDPELHRVERMLAAVERAKRALRGPDRSGLAGARKAFYAVYQRSLHKANAFDFSDLILQPNRLFERHPDVLEKYRGRFSHVLVDEFQDTDLAQYALLQKLCQPGANLCVVGDDDQSIYTWRGAEVANILGFARHYPGCKTVKLEHNYRSSGNILEAASAVIARNPVRHEKELWSDADPGEPVRLFAARDEREEAQQVAQRIVAAAEQGRPLGEIAVFYRVNAQSRALEEGLRLYAVPYRVVGGVRFFDRAEIRDLLAYLRLVANPRSDVDLLRILNVPARGLGNRTRARLSELAGRHDCPLLDAIRPDRLEVLRKTERDRALGFGRLLEDLAEQARGRPAAEVVRLLIDGSGYGEWLRRQGSAEAMGRLENLQELITAAEDFARGTEDETLQSFLEHVALLTDIDLAEEGSQAVTLMTLHSAKGLEFNLVFMTGVEEGLLPHRRSLEQEGDGTTSNGIEEERRLCYVGMTRAREHLALSYARSRSIAGRDVINQPSRFLGDLPGLDQTRGRAGRGKPCAVVDLTDFDLDEDDDIFGDDLVVDYGDEYSQVEDGPEAWRGRRVEHVTFGRGRVRDVQPSSLGPKLTVQFESFGIKTVMASHLRLVPGR